MARSRSIIAQNAIAKRTLCQADGCPAFRRSVSRYCAAHENNAQRYGGPEARVITYAETRQYEALMDRWLKVQAGHPVLVSAYAELQRLIDNSTAYTLPHHLRRLDYHSRLQRELRRLSEGGVSGAEVFRAVATVFLFASSQPRTLAPLSLPHRFATARRVLSLRARYRHATKGGEHVNRLSSLVLDNLGRDLIRLLYPVLVAVASSIESCRASEREKHQRYAEQLSATPFNPIAVK